MFQFSLLSLRAAKRLQSDAIDPDYFTCIGPILCFRDETCTNRIVAYIIPFFLVAFVVPQDVIEKPGLPQWLWSLFARNSLSQKLF